MSFDPRAAEDAFTIVKDDGLARRDGALWLGKDDADAAFGLRMNSRCRGRMAIANLRLARHGPSRRLDQPVHARRDQERREQFFPVAENHVMALRQNI